MRRVSVGAECLPDGGVEFRVWAPGHESVEVMIEGSTSVHGSSAEADGYFCARVANAGPGTLYRYRVDGRGPFPDPASRFQPAGPDGPSEVIDPGSYAWSDAGWRGIELVGQVFYELHVGTFTPEGTLQAAETKLSHLRDLGVTVIELLPLADFAGDFGWGYDGVNWYAPRHQYGRPDQLRHFIDAAHRMHIAVILDVVYNHLGPSGNYLPAFSPHYFSAHNSTEWGEALNFDADHARPVREYVCENATYWLREFHVDGFRLDATQSLFDRSPEHIIAELARRARAAAAEVGRKIVVVAENEPQDSKLLRPAAEGGCGLDALWNDDFHHSAVVALTGRREAYYTDYLGRAEELVACARSGFLYQGQYYAWQKKRRGRPTRGLEMHRFVGYLENHDQVANTPAGERLWQSAQPATHRALTALLLLGPWTPLLFQGQEWSSQAPFAYFAQHTPPLSADVHRGRQQFIAQFPSLASVAVQENMPDPSARRTFDACKLDWADDLSSARARRSLRLHTDLLRLRREDAVLRPGAAGVQLEAAVLTDACLLLRWFTDDRRDRLLIVNLGRDLVLRPAPEPLLAPPDGCAFRLHWSSEEPRYGGLGQESEISDDSGLRVPAHATVLFAAQPREDA